MGETGDLRGGGRESVNVEHWDQGAMLRERCHGITEARSFAEDPIGRMVPILDAVIKKIRSPKVRSGLEIQRIKICPSNWELLRSREYSANFRASAIP
jgi:hypothetical protein